MKSKLFTHDNQQFWIINGKLMTTFDGFNFAETDFRLEIVEFERQEKINLDRLAIYAEREPTTGMIDAATGILSILPRRAEQARKCAEILKSEFINFAQKPISVG